MQNWVQGQAVFFCTFHKLDLCDVQSWCIHSDLHGEHMQSNVDDKQKSDTSMILCEVTGGVLKCYLPY